MTLSALSTTDSAASSACAEPASDAALRPCVLLVEDNVTNQLVARGLLKKLGCEVKVAENGRKGVEAVQKGGFSLVLMDIQMPEMDGLEATRAIRQWEKEQGRSEKLPIIALTAHALESDRLACLQAGMDEFLSKPVTVQELRRVLLGFLPGCRTPGSGTPPQAGMAW